MLFFIFMCTSFEVFFFSKFSASGRINLAIRILTVNIALLLSFSKQLLYYFELSVVAAATFWIVNCWFKIFLEIFQPLQVNCFLSFIIDKNMYTKYLVHVLNTWVYSREFKVFFNSYLDI